MKNLQRITAPVIIGLSSLASTVYAAPCGTTAGGPCLHDPSTLGIPMVYVDSAAHSIYILLSTIAGILSVFFLVYGGIKYITSSGNPQRIESAKQTLLYAVIGLIVSILAGAIISFVVTKSP